MMFMRSHAFASSHTSYPHSSNSVEEALTCLSPRSNVRLLDLKHELGVADKDAWTLDAIETARLPCHSAATCLQPRKLIAAVTIILITVVVIIRPTKRVALTRKAEKDEGSMLSRQQPAWLNAILADTRPPPKLFAWTPANLSVHAAEQGRVGNGRSEKPADWNGNPNGTDPTLARRIFILGVGNIGRLYASHLARNPDPVLITLVVHRKELLSQWVASEGVWLSRHDSGTTIKNKDFNIEWWTETRPQYGTVREVANGGKLHNIFISTKSSDAIPEADRLRRYLDKSSSVVFAQNGMSNLWPPHGPLYATSRYEAGNTPTFSACVVNHGVLSTGPFQSVHMAPANAFIGPVLRRARSLLHAQQEQQHAEQPDQTEEVQEASVTGHGEVDFFTKYITRTPLLNTKLVSSGELWLLQLEKLAMNSVINPLTALLRCRNGDLFTSHDPRDPLVHLLDRLIQETSAVIQALINHEVSANMLISYAQNCKQSPLKLDPDGHDYAREGTLPNTTLRSQLLGRFSPPSLTSKLYALGHKVADNRSSMLQDVEAGKTTEIRDINGWIVDMAAFLDTSLDVTLHRNLIALVEKREFLNKRDLASKVGFKDQGFE
ncbi:hypothetical protein E4U61_005246 [Claviceps capensis]|nr:hypothetical protein E4U61_005246 [Claviceps capensis]